MGEDIHQYEEEEPKSYTKVILAVLVILVFAAGTFFAIRALKSYKIYLNFSDTSGLRAGSPVAMNGVDVGEVNELDLDTSGSARAEIKLFSKYRKVIPVGSVFRIADIGSDSLPIIEIEILDKDTPILERNGTYPGASNYLEYVQQSVSILGEGYLRKVSLGVLDVKTDIQRSGVKQTFRLEVGKFIPTQLLFTGILPSGRGWNIEETAEGDYKRILVSGELAEVSGTAWANSEIILQEEKSLLWKDCTYTQKFSNGGFQMELIEESEGLKKEDWAEIGTKILICILDQSRTTCAALLENVSDLPELFRIILEGLGNELNQVATYPLERVDVNMTISFPGQILETNADFKSARTLTWDTTGNEINNGYEVYAEYRVWKAPLWVLVTAAVLLLGGGGYWAFYVKGGGIQRTKKKDKSIFDSV